MRTLHARHARAKLRFAAPLVVAAALGVTPLAATHPEIDPGILRCQVASNDVTLTWQIEFVRPILAWIIARDGVDIARLDSDERSYVDVGAPDGEHHYTLTALDRTSADGEVSVLMGQCRVVVGDFGMRCAVVGKSVELEWGPILIDVAFRNFVITRNGAVIARVPADQLKYTDTVPEPGVYRYVVQAEFYEGHGFVVGACTARVRSDGFVCRVDPPNVHLDWSGVILPAIAFEAFVVVRDDMRIATTREFRYTDAPGPGRHHYRVFAIWGLAQPDDVLADRNTDPAVSNTILVGECTIFMPGDRIPPPEELTCVDLDAPPELRDAEVYLREHDVLLVWQKPIDYDWVAISRNDEFVARIPGDQFYYVDRDVPLGVHVYSVSGIVGEQSSPPATCEVAIPRPPVPPPTDLRCEYHPELDGPAAEGIVELQWSNGGPYEWVVIVKNGVRVTRLPGNTTGWSDLDPAPGVTTYGVFGVVGLRRSEAAECQVRVPPGPLPPPRDLTCSVISPVPVPGPLPVDQVVVGGDPGNAVGDDDDVFAPPGVFLRWSNPVEYERITITRNGLLIATLPGNSQSYFDHATSLAGVLRYEVRGLVADRVSDPAVCEVKIEPPIPPPPRDLTCEVDTVIFQPDDALGGVAGPLTVVKLTWVNPVRYAAIVVSRDGEAIARLAGNASFFRDVDPGAGVHVYEVRGVGADGTLGRPARCEVEVPPVPVPPVHGLTCVAVDTNAQGPTAALVWRNGAAYDEIVIVRNDEERVVLPGDATSFNDMGLDPGVYTYRVIGVIGNRSSRPVECSVVIEGPGPRNLLYFSSGLFLANEVDAPVPLAGNGRVVSMASNHDPLQGWSFGICSDPDFLAVEDATIEDTDTAALNGGAGPSFLVLNRFEDGVVMAVIVDELDTSNTLPPGTSHRLLRLSYGAGPAAEPGGTYPVHYCETLGDPPVAVLYVVGGFGLEPETQRGFVSLPEPIRPGFIRADSNADGDVDQSDAVLTLRWLFNDGRRPPCLEAADANANGTVDIADPIYGLQYKFQGGPPPPAPFPRCGPAELTIGCEEPACP